MWPDHPGRRRVQRQRRGLDQPGCHRNLCSLQWRDQIYLQRPPTGWPNIGDAAGVILFNGAYLQSSCCDGHNPPGLQNAIFNGPNSWIAERQRTAATTDESGYTLLPNGQVLMVDTKTVSACSNPTQSSELYTVTDPVTGVGTWSCGPSLPRTALRRRRGAGFRHDDVQQQALPGRRQQECHCRFMT